MNLKKLAFALVLALPFAASAGDLSYSYLQAGVTRVNPDDGGAENGFGFGGAGALTENWHVFGNYRSYDVNVLGTDFDVDGWNVGLGYNMGISDSADFFGRVSYEKVDADIVDANGWGIEAGVRNAFTDQFEAGASLKYIDIEDDNNTGLELYGQYKFGEWGLVGTLNISDDGNEIFIGPRISF
ncbi:MAG TPA: outer membrane beta-barrel protein [Patescibacteria group bacterium]|nr:outer membrane beta-barrel protein [Patescibacteria group bacterium]